MNRLKKAWRVLWGEDLGTGYPYKFVQLMYFRDDVIGLTGAGDLYKISFGYNCYDNYVTLLMQNPVSRW